MTPADIIQRAAVAGVSITADGLNLRVRGPREAIAEITPLVKTHKPAILAALAANDAPIAEDLERLIRRAGTVYEYGPGDFSMMRDIASRDPAGLRLALETDVLLNAIFKRDLIA